MITFSFRRRLRWLRLASLALLLLTISCVHQRLQGVAASHRWLTESKIKAAYGDVDGIQSAAEAGINLFLAPALIMSAGRMPQGDNVTGGSAWAAQSFIAPAQQITQLAVDVSRHPQHAIDLEISVCEDAGGVPGRAIFQEAIPAVSVSTGECRLVQANLTSSLQVQPGSRYHVRLNAAGNRGPSHSVYFWRLTDSVSTEANSDGVCSTDGGRTWTSNTRDFAVAVRFDDKREIRIAQSWRERGFAIVPDQIRSVEKAADLAEQSGVRLMPVVKYPGPQRLSFMRGQYRPAIGSEPVGEKTPPCPRDQSYWDSVIKPQLRALAGASRKHPGLAGVVIDFEMYGCNPSSFDEGYCFCDDCFRSFRCSKGMSNDPPIPIEHRQAWIDSNNLSQVYSNWQCQEMNRIAVDLRHCVHRINPRLVLGFYYPEQPLRLLEHGPHYRGFAAGLGTAEKPCLALPFVRTHPSTSESFLEAPPNGLRVLFSPWEQDGIHCVWLGGVILGGFRVDELRSVLTQTLDKDAGYWLFSWRSLARETLPSDDHPDYRLPEQPVRYREMLRNLNSSQP